MVCLHTSACRCRCPGGKLAAFVARSRLRRSLRWVRKHMPMTDKPRVSSLQAAGATRKEPLLLCYNLLNPAPSQDVPPQVGLLRDRLPAAEVEYAIEDALLQAGHAGDA